MKNFFKNLFSKKPSNYFILNSSNGVTKLLTNEKDFVLNCKNGEASYVVNQPESK